MRLILKGQAILAKSGLQNAHQLSLAARVSYPTADKYINRPADIRAVDLGILAQVLTGGLGIAPEDALELRLGDVFEIGE